MALLSNPHFRRTLLGAGTTAALLGLYVKNQQGRKIEESARSMATVSDAKLSSMWTTAMDGMINVPGCDALSSAEGVLYLAPMPSKPPDPPTAWPKIFAKGVVFALTASNPMGIDAPAAENQAANEALEQDILDLQRRQMAPRAWWRSFGFNVQARLCDGSGSFTFLCGFTFPCVAAPTH